MPRLSLSVMLAFLFVIFSCSANSANDELSGAASEGIRESQVTEPVFRSTALWQFGSSFDNPEGSSTISVCWETPFTVEPDNSTIRKWVQQQAALWAKSAHIEGFTGWQECRPGAAGVRIGFHQSVEPRVLALGKFLDGVANGVVFSAGKNHPWARRCASAVGGQGQSDWYERCMRWQITHLFGHVLGASDVGADRGKSCLMMLEHAPLDKVDEIAGKSNSSPPLAGEGKMKQTKQIQAQQIDTVMRPCPDRASILSAVLSENDVLQVRKAYCGSECLVRNNYNRGRSNE